MFSDFKIKDIVIPLAVSSIPSLRPAYEIYEMKQKEKMLKEYEKSLPPVTVEKLEIPWIPMMAIVGGVIIFLYFLSRRV